MRTRRLGWLATAIAIAIIAAGLVLALLGLQQLVGYVLTSDERGAVNRAEDQIRRQFERAQDEVAAAHATGDPAAVEQALAELTTSNRPTELYRAAADPGMVYALIVFSASVPYSGMFGTANADVKGCVWLESRLDVKHGGDPRWEDGQCPPRGTGRTVTLTA